METNIVVRRLRGVFPIAALAIVALVAVTTAMTILGDTQSDPTVGPSGSITASASPTAHRSPSASPTDAASPVMTVPLPSGTPVILTVYKGERDPQRIWFVVWRYPQFRVGSTPLAALMNQDILDEIKVRITTFESGPAAVRQLPGKANTLTGTFTVDMLTSDLASLTLKWVDDTAPGHPATTIETLTYTLNSGQRVNFSDMFVDTQAAVAVIAQQSQAQLRRSLGADFDPVVVADGAAAVDSNFNNWSLTPAGLKITFDEYQVGSYADGLPAVVIPWSTLKSLMKADGPIARLAGFPTPS